MLAACWFAVIKAGGIAVTTMSQIRAQELVAIANKARIKYALCEQGLAEELIKAQSLAPVLEESSSSKVQAAEILQRRKSRRRGSSNLAPRLLGRLCQR